MKIKEELSKDFKKEVSYQDKIQTTLKHKGSLFLLEQKSIREDLPYSNFLIYDMKWNISYLRIFVPDPKEKDLYKDIFLKYQSGARRFMSNFFDVLTGEKNDIETAYKIKQKKDFEYIQNEDDDGTVWIKLIGDGYLFAIVGFTDKEINTRVAEKFIKFFEGIPVDFSDEVGLCEQ